MEEYISYCDFSDLEGDFECLEFDYSLEECNERPKVECKDCLGYTYSMPTHINGFRKTEEKWNGKYGEGSHHEYLLIKRKAKGYLHQLKFHDCISKEEKELIIKVIDLFTNKREEC